MSSTHLSFYYHLVFSTHDRLRWIDKSWQDRLAQYIGGIVRDIEGIRKYIRNQREHHRKKTFQEEYIELLNENGIEFDEKCL
jgi:hypothetical protein